MMEITLESIVGKVMLVGYTRRKADGAVLNRSQRWGTVVAADERCITIETSDGQIFTLPPDLRSTQVAPPGTYRLHSTGEVIENPDLLSTWIVDVEEDQ